MAVHLSAGCYYTYSPGSSYSSGSSAMDNSIASYLELSMTTTPPPVPYPFLPSQAMHPACPPLQPPFLAAPPGRAPFPAAPPGPGDRAEAVRLAEAAAARLRDKGWTRGTYGDKEGPNCLLGALGWEAVREYEHAQLWPGWSLLMSVLRSLAAAAGYHLGQGQAEHDLIAWNDGFCPDVATAADMLLTAAKRLGEEGTP